MEQQIVKIKNKKEKTVKIHNEIFTAILYNIISQRTYLHRSSCT